MAETFTYNNLTELLLNIVRHRPGMYLGQNHISKLPNFIIGYSFRDHLSTEKDFYFGENGFLDWYERKYNPKQSSFWHDHFLIEAKNDEVKALEIFFARLEEYYEWYKSLKTD